jgi:hypothetical protein
MSTNPMTIPPTIYQPPTADDIPDHAAAVWREFEQLRHARRWSEVLACADEIAALASDVIDLRGISLLAADEALVAAHEAHDAEARR